jgi:hypothetical protein
VRTRSPMRPRASRRQEDAASISRPLFWICTFLDLAGSCATVIQPRCAQQDLGSRQQTRLGRGRKTDSVHTLRKTLRCTNPLSGVLAYPSHPREHAHEPVLVGTSSSLVSALSSPYSHRMHMRHAHIHVPPGSCASLARCRRCPQSPPKLRSELRRRRVGIVTGSTRG